MIKGFVFLEAEATLWVNILVRYTPEVEERVVSGDDAHESGELAPREGGNMLG